MKLLSKKSLLKECKYKTILMVGYIFTIVGILFVAITWRQTDFHMLGSIVQFAVTTIFAGSIAYVCGIKNVIYAKRLVRDINTGNMRIIVKTIADIEVVRAISNDHNCRVEFEDESYVMLHKKIRNEVKVGDKCFVFYVGNSEKIHDIYNIEKSRLDQELDEIFRKGDAIWH